MTANEVKREIDGATQMFQAWEEEHGIRVSPSIHFTGGEPFLYKGLWDVIAYSKAKGYGVAMMTNGCFVTKDEPKRPSILEYLTSRSAWKDRRSFMHRFGEEEASMLQPKALNSWLQPETESVPTSPFHESMSIRLKRRLRSQGKWVFTASVSPEWSLVEGEKPCWITS